VAHDNHLIILLFHKDKFQAFNSKNQQSNNYKQQSVKPQLQATER